MLRSASVLMLLLGASSVTWAAELRAVVTAADGAPIQDAVIVAVSASASAAAPISSSGEQTVEQIEKQFQPYVKVVQAGSSVSFPNKDKVMHHVYSFSTAKRFELPLYAGTPAAPVVFDKPGVVALGCNIHDWMVGYIYVADSPWFGTTGPDGKATIGGLPPGTYHVRAWHPRMTATEESTVRDIEVTDAAPAEQAWQLTLKPDLRARRAPVPGFGGY